MYVHVQVDGVGMDGRLCGVDSDLGLRSGVHNILGAGHILIANLVAPGPAAHANGHKGDERHKGNSRNSSTSNHHTRAARATRAGSR